MIVLLIVSQIYLPRSVSNIILGNKIMLNPFNYISWNFIKFYHVLIGWFDSVQSNNGLIQIGLESGSALVNNSTLISMFVLFIPVHLLIWLLMLIINKRSSIENQGCMIKICKYLATKTFAILTYGFYIRTIIESILVLALSTFSEIFNFNVNDVNKASSFAVCTLIILVIIMFLALSVCLAFRQIQDEDVKIDKYREFYCGLKKTKLCQLYTTVWLCRRLLFVLLIVSISPNSPLLALQILSVVQLLYFIYVVVQRPYIEVKENLIEIINELFFLIYLSWFWHFSTESKWSSTSSNVYMYLILANNGLVFLVISISFSLLICQSCTSLSNLFKTQVSPTQEEIVQDNRTAIIIRSPISVIEESKSFAEESKIQETIKKIAKRPIIFIP